MPERPRILVLEGPDRSAGDLLQSTRPGWDIVRTNSIGQGLSLLRSEHFDGVYADIKDPAVCSAEELQPKIKQINDIIAKLDDGKMVTYLDIGGKFLQPDGTLPRTMFPDLLHPNTSGYQIWADQLVPVLDEWLK